MNTVETLIEARRLIEDPQDWCAKDTALDPFGERVDPWDPPAVQFCAGGAVERVVHRIGSGYYGDFKDATWFLNLAGEQLLSRRPDFTSYITVNDRLGHEAVLAMFDGAIELAREAEAAE